MAASIEAFQQNSHLFGDKADQVRELYNRYQRAPGSVSAEWRVWFQALERQSKAGQATPAQQRPQKPGTPAEIASQKLAGKDAPATREAMQTKQAAVLRLINAHRVRGHQVADVDPLGLREPAYVADLDPTFHGLLDADMDVVFNTGSLFADDQLPLREIIQSLKRIYCGPIGSEFMHITSTFEKRWIQDRLERQWLRSEMSAEEKRHIFERLTAAEGLERYLHNKYVGQKRFSLEGGEGFIPCLDELVQRAGAAGIKEAVIGMAHRGRLNVLVNIIGKSPALLFEEFEGKVDHRKTKGSGDVKYHMGFSSDVMTPGGRLHLALAFNPSHLEIVNPVVEGSVRARQNRRNDKRFEEVLPILVHGDAAFAGQGVIMECFNMSQAHGFATGGTVHIIINNQIGFTTSDPLDARSTFYCTEVAKMVQAPILHVNGDHPEAVVYATQMALDYRQEFHKDVVIDIVCYRRHGHNEADEPAATQPMMYKAIKALPTTVTLYGKELIAQGVLPEDGPAAVKQAYRNKMDAGAMVANGVVEGEPNEFAVNWQPYTDKDWTEPADTTMGIEQIQALSDRLLALPEGFVLHPRVQKIMEARKRMASGALPMDWGFAETMAYAGLLAGGHQVRLSGQDCERGTFFHRHAVLHNMKNGDTHTPLKTVGEGKARFTVINSLLSEEAVLGFEYGYATAEPEALVIWEAQFGDFANGAQVVIDQFITSGQSKWGRLCGLVMFLPHGQEGQGPEHSSARLERYLQLSAEHNIQICTPTTPAQAFHMLRRQALRPYRHPLIVMTPKSLLRHKLATSSLEDLADEGFKTVIDETDALRPGDITRIVLCSGKVYYDLLEARREREINNVALIRIEQLYPFPKQALPEVLKQYTRAKEVVWCQEEPMNQGAWFQIQHKLLAAKSPRQSLRYAGRPSMAAPAAGFMALHLEQLRSFVDDALL